jgi:large subunit ribosomal protein L32
MAVPKRKTSKSKVRSRKGSHRRPLAVAASCTECGAPTLPHRVCRSCGTYRGRQVLTITSDEE